MFADKLLINATTINAQGQELINQAIAIKNGLIAWCDYETALPTYYQAKEVINCENQLVTPGLINCHTHLVYAGNRADEYKKRLEGVTYAAIARAGGGILSTVRQTRMTSEEALIEQSLPRILAMRDEGVTTVEIKSGYGLTLESELKLLRVAKKLGSLCGLRVKTCFLGAHTIPAEFRANPQSYVNFLCEELMPAVAQEKLADAVDVFCETVGFSLGQTEQLFIKAKALGLPIKCHAEQLSNLGASELASQFGALSCDHLEHLNASGVAAMARNKTVAVLLPGAYYFLKETKKPPISLLRSAGVGMAIATDTNPGTSPTTSLLLMLNMACQFFDLTVSEALSGITYQAARALGIADQVGSITEGLSADLVLWSVKESAALCYYFGYPLQHRTIIAGEWQK